MSTKILQILEGGVLSPSYQNTIDFANESEQDNYWTNKVILSLEVEGVYLNENIPLRINKDFDEAINYNYARFYYNGKWYYYFINNITYAGDKNTGLECEIDVMQTYMFDYEILESFVEREHQDRYDVVGNPILNRIDENLDLGKNVDVSDPLYIDNTSLCFYHVITSAPIGVEDEFEAAKPNLTSDSKLKIEGMGQPFYHYLLPFDITTPLKEFYIKEGDILNKLESTPNLVESLATSQNTQAIRLLPYSPLDYQITGENFDIIEFTGGGIRSNYPNNPNFIIADEQGSYGDGLGSDYDITYNTSEFGSITGPLREYAGRVVTVTANPISEDYELTAIQIFNGSGGTTPSINANSFTMPDSNVVVVPTFEEVFKEYPITVTYDSTKINVTGPTAALAGIEITLTAIPVEFGYRITIASEGTNVDTTYDPDNNTIKFIMPKKDVTISLGLTESSYTVRYYFTGLGERATVNGPSVAYGGDTDFSFYVTAWSGYELTTLQCLINGEAVPASQVNQVNPPDIPGWQVVEYLGRIGTIPRGTGTIAIYIGTAGLDDPDPGVEYSVTTIDSYYNGALFDTINVVDGVDSYDIMLGVEQVGTITLDHQVVTENSVINSVITSRYQIDEGTGQGGYFIANAYCLTDPGGSALTPNYVDYNKYDNLIYRLTSGHQITNNVKYAIYFNKQ